MVLVGLPTTNVANFIVLLILVTVPGARMMSNKSCPTKRLAKEKIQMGTDAAAGRYPYAVSLQKVVFRANRLIKPKDHFCGGALIDKDLVITAAHCVHPLAPGSVTHPFMNIGGRALVYDPDTERRSSCRTIVHQNFNPANITDGYDIALIQLNMNSTKTPVKIELDTEQRSQGIVRALGWGKDATKPFFVNLQQVDFDIVDNKDCRAQVFPHIINSMMCAKGNSSDVCKGDSGGPLIKAGGGCGENDMLVGLASHGISCTNPVEGQGKSPGVYTRIFDFCHWITRRGKGESDEWTNPDCEELIASP